jgi:hypothetical protein
MKLLYGDIKIIPTNYVLKVINYKHSEDAKL